MKIIQTKGIVENGKLIANIPSEFNNNLEVDVIIIAKNEPDELESMRQLAKENGYDSKEKILELIKKVKSEILAEKGLKK